MMDLVKRVHKQGIIILLVASVISAFFDWPKLPIGIFFGGLLVRPGWYRGWACAPLDHRAPNRSLTRLSKYLLLAVVPMALRRRMGRGFIQVTVRVLPALPGSSPNSWV